MIPFKLNVFYRILGTEMLPMEKNFCQDHLIQTIQSTKDYQESKLCPSINRMIMMCGFMLFGSSGTLITCSFCPIHTFVQF